MLSVLRGCEALSNCTADGGFSDRVMERNATRFERRGERLGHTVRELLFKRAPA
jgi:tRNA (guanine-N7-)-methyltransferase